VGSTVNNALIVFYGRGDGTLESPVTVFTSADRMSPQCAEDMNNDGRQDLIARDGRDRVYVLFSKGNRTFDPVWVTVGSQPTMVAVADFDGDNYRDIAVTIPGNGPGGNLTIAKNNGNGTFTKKDSYGIPGIAIGVTTGDVNNDGRPDAVATFTTSTVNRSGFLVFLGDGTGRFTTGNRYDTATMNVVTPVIADFNRDGKQDVSVTNYFDHNISVHWGNGNGTFQSAENYTAGPYPHIMRSADFDNDNYPDLIAANAGSSNFTILRNLRTGLFASQAKFDSGGNNTRTCDVADFNNDGRMDAVFGNESSDNITLNINDSR
jgi:hypothetical protein